MRIHALMLHDVLNGKIGTACRLDEPALLRVVNRDIHIQVAQVRQLVRLADNPLNPFIFRFLQSLLALDFISIADHNYQSVQILYYRKIIVLSYLRKGDQ